VHSLTRAPRRSALTAKLDEIGNGLPRAVSYPYDDMLVGSWVQEHAPGTDVVEDPAGFHNPPRHGGTNAWKEGLVGWDSVVVHHVSTAEMAALRARPEWADEWDVPPPRKADA
jgi:hypothetical protein